MAEETTAATSRAAGPAWRRWLFLIVPAVAIVELGLHIHQVRSVTPDDDWKAAKPLVQKRIKPDDLLVFSPRWVDPVGRQFFGNELATYEREGYGDVSRYPRAIEVSIRGAHNPELEGWKAVESETAGSVTVTTYENPAPVKLVDDLMPHIGEAGTHVFEETGNGEHECSFQHLTAVAGSLFGGPAAPADRYVCPSAAIVGLSIVADMEYRPRRCIYAPLNIGGVSLKIRFDAIHFGKALHGHHLVSVFQEREGTGAPVTLSFSSGSKVIGRVVHRDRDWWKPFEFDTSDLAGSTGELVTEVTAPRPDGRLYCFEADTR